MISKPKINPAILVNNLTDFAKQIRAAENYTDEVDIDIIDWRRTSEKTISVLDALSIETGLKLNFDLMLDYPAPAVDQLLANTTAKIQRLILNLESKIDLNPLIESIKQHGKQVGISLDPNHNLLDVEPYLDLIDLVQIYTVEPGAQGNPFLPDRLKLMREIRDKGFKGMFEVDGGFNEQDEALIKNFLPDYISAGSVISKATDPEAEFNRLKQALA